MTTQKTKPEFMTEQTSKTPRTDAFMEKLHANPSCGSDQFQWEVEAFCQSLEKGYNDRLSVLYDTQQECIQKQGEIEELKLDNAGLDKKFTHLETELQEARDRNSQWQKKYAQAMENWADDNCKSADRIKALENRVYELEVM